MDMDGSATAEEDTQQEEYVLCVLGGENEVRHELDTVEWLDTVSGEWKKGPDMQEARFNPVTALMQRNNKPTLFVAGGSNGGVALNTAEVQTSDIETEWNWLPDMQDCRLAAGAGLIDTRLFVAGGSDRMSGAFALDTLEWFDIPSNQWRRGNSMRRRRQGCCCCVINGLLYAIGGAAEDRKITETCEAYNPVTDEWQQVASMGIARQDAACAVVDGMIVVIGGTDGVQALDCCEVYDPSCNEWSRIADMCERRQGCAAAATADGSLYVVGGMDYVVGGADSDHQMRILSSVELFDKVSHTWKPVASMHSARRSPSAVMVPCSIVNREPEQHGLLPQV